MNTGIETLAVAVRLALYVVVLGLFGTASVGLYAPAAFNLARPRHAMIWAVGLGMAVTALSLGVLAIQMTGEMTSVLDPCALMHVATGTGAGVATLMRFSVLSVALAFMVRRFEPGPSYAAAVVGLAAVAAASLAWGGHAAASEGLIAVVRLASDILHLLAAGTWLGALLVFLHLVRRASQDDRNRVHASLTRFAGIGSGVVAVLLLTGVVNLALALGWDRLTSVTTTFWGQLLLVKLTLFAGMLGLAALNRFRLTPALAATDVSMRRAAWLGLRLSLVLETTLAFLVIAFVAWLGTLSPLPGA